MALTSDIIALQQAGIPFCATVDGSGNIVSSGTTAGGQSVQGSVASGATDSGNPVKVAGKYNSTKPTFTDGQRGDIQIGTRGSQIAQLALPDSTSAVTSQAAGADAVSNTFNAYLGASIPYTFNGTTWDRNRSIINATDSTGTGITAAGILAQLDDTSPGTVTENQFGNVRMDPMRQLRVNTEGGKATYTAAGQISVASSATQILSLYGSASKTVRITRIELSSYATATGTVPLQIIKHSAVASGGTSGAGTAVPHDSGNAAATGTVLAYTANPTPGASVGNIVFNEWSIPALSASAFGGNPVKFDFTTRNGQGIVLRGTAQGISVQLSGASLAGQVVGYTIEWTEE